MKDMCYGSGTRIQLTGITGAATEAEKADSVFPVIAADGSHHAISIRGKNIVATRTTDNILSLAVLLKAVYKVNFRVGTDLDPTDGGDWYTPKGKCIALVFAGNLWRLPMWSSHTPVPRSRRTPVIQHSLRMYNARQGCGYPANFPSLFAILNVKLCRAGFA